MLEIIKYVPLSRLKDYLVTIVPRLTPKKIANIIQTEISFAQKKKTITSFPYLMLLSPTNICQLKCALCSTGQGKITRPKGMMKWTIFKKIIDEIGDYLLLINISGWGEPFLNSDLLKFVSYANQKKIGTLISTNFSLPFSEDRITEIIKSGLDILIVSLDGITPEVYNKYRVGGNFQRVINNIKLLAQLKKKYHSCKPIIQWQFLVNKYNEKQIPRLKQMAKELGVNSVALDQTVILFGQVKPEHLNLNDWLPKNQKYRPVGLTAKTNKSESIPMGNCWWLWRDFVLAHDGGIDSCCHSNFQKDDFGNILSNSFSEIWNNQFYQSARSLFQGGKGTIKTVCHNCPIATHQT